MGIFKKVFNGIKNIAKKIPVVGTAVSAADDVYNAMKKKGTSSATSKSSAGAKANAKTATAKQWFAWAPNWVIIAGGALLSGGILWAVLGKKKGRRRR